MIVQRLRLFSLAMLALALGGNCKAAACEVLRVIDGDTVRARIDDVVQSVRVRGYDADELRQEMGPAARDKLQLILSSGELSCDCKGSDRYGRSLCRLLIDGQDVGPQMLRVGLACIDPRYVHELGPDERIAAPQALASAKAAGVGRWASTLDTTCPADWRKQQRQQRQSD